MLVGVEQFLKPIHRVEQFAALESLEQLSIPRNAVTDKGLAHLKRLKKLKNLDVNMTQVTAAGVADLEQAVPGCKVQWQDK